MLSCVFFYINVLQLCTFCDCFACFVKWKYQMFCGTCTATTSSSFLASSKPYKKWENLLKKILRLVVVIYSSRERFSIECRKQSGNYFGFGFTSVCDWLSSPTGQLLVWGLVLQHSTENHSRDFYISWIKPLWRVGLIYLCYPYS